MSNLFKAFQRSENEQVGSDSSRPAKVTELLQRAEHRAVSNWEATVFDVEPEAKSFANNNEIVGRDKFSLPKRSRLRRVLRKGCLQMSVRTF